MGAVISALAPGVGADVQQLLGSGDSVARHSPQQVSLHLSGGRKQAMFNSAQLIKQGRFIKRVKHGIHDFTEY
jgi:hypothetical protein